MAEGAWDVVARRPPNRKDQIIAAAGEMFLARGYHNVSVTDVADALDITPSALYHHFRNKQDLLFEVVWSGLEKVDAALLQCGTLDEAIGALSATIVRSTGLATVWEREARHLEGTQREQIRERESQVIAHMVPLIVAGRGDLTPEAGELAARAVFGSLGGFRRRYSLSRRDDEAIMARLGELIGGADASMLGTPPALERHGGDDGADDMGAQISRREQLIGIGARLFDQFGFQSVTMSDIGKAAGIVASAVYRHFGAKTDLLVAAATRGRERLRAGADRALADAVDPSDAVERLVRSHVVVSLQNPHLIGILANERAQLPDKERTETRRFHTDYLDVWLQTITAAASHREPAETRMRVAAVHSMIYFVAHSRAGSPPWPGLDDWLTRLGVAALLDR
ncbi:TetR/AcrR family transcriptional regulator [Rhodococcus koreensis]|uniref:TetR/AcrR family transcriptional regulator n=1 Tax=Rhodococcus koreensis TaxID=99653 RepID=UPI00115FC148|nr:TetR/AcrR family transcriptional regulator [Rhodococcus koreensis]